MTDEEAKEITERAAIRLKHWDRPIIIHTDMTHTVGLIGMVQLALTHPGCAKSETSQMTKRLILDLIYKIDPNKGDVYKFLMMGFDRKRDA
jgi:hypothetical protein